MKPDIYVLVTCDTEFLPPWYEGTWENMKTWPFEQGTPVLKEILEGYGIRGTFFTQATAIERFPDIIRELDRSGHHIGSHGYNHENYGGRPVNVWTESKPVFIADNELKKELIQKCLDIHQQVLGKHPEAFVAPFDSIDENLLHILNDLHFKVDCSFHNYSLGLNSFPFHPSDNISLVEIPLTVLDSRTNLFKNLLEAFTYNPALAIEQLDEYMSFSLEKHPFCMILITCHPYEFIDVKIPHPASVLIVGPKKINALKALIEYLKGMGAEFVTPLQILEIYKKIS